MTAFRPFLNLATGVWVAARAAGTQTCSPGHARRFAGATDQLI
jgi:hypothetical protein